MSHADEQRSAFSEGYDANTRGLKLDDNPHADFHSLAYQEWQDGWMAKEKKKKLREISASEAIVSTKTQTKVPFDVRDMPEVLSIESASFEFAWSEEDFIRCFRQRNCIGMVAEHDERIIGYMIYEIFQNRIHLLTLAVHPDFCGQGAGRMLVEKLKSKLQSTRRNRITLETRETNLNAQTFFRHMGFKATDVIHDFYKDTSEDAYRMEYRIGDKACDAG